MLVIRKLTPDMAPLLRPIADETLVGDSARLKIGRSGFSLCYEPLEPAQWRTFPPLPGCTPEAILAQGGSVLYAAFRDERFVGAAVVRPGDTGWCDLLDLRVDAGCRREGVARQLLSSCERFAARRGLSGLRAAVSDGNPAMCQFLEHTGFHLQGVDQLLLSSLPTERSKPRALRACALLFYKDLSGSV